MFTRNSNTSTKTMMNAHKFWCRLPRRPQVCTRNQENTNCTYRLLLGRVKIGILMPWRTIMLLCILRSSKYIRNTLNQFMHLVRLMWRSAPESKPVHSRYSWLSQAWRTAEPIRIISAVSDWFSRRTSHELTVIEFDSAHVKYGVWTEPKSLANIRELKHERFWDADGNRKWAVFTFNLPAHNHIHIAKYLLSVRNEQNENLGDNAFLAREIFPSGCRPRLGNARA